MFRTTAIAAAALLTLTAPWAAADSETRPDYCPDVPAPCAGWEDEYSQHDAPMEEIEDAATGSDADGRPYACPPAPAPCALLPEDAPEDAPQPEPVPEVAPQPEATQEASQAPAPAPQPAPTQRTERPVALPKTGVDR